MKYLIAFLLIASASLGANVQDSQLNEISGIDTSLKHKEVIYAHNDSGDKARFFAIDFDGKTIAEIELDGTKARDWEDMTTAPCGKTTCLYAADFGDNDHNRKDYSIVEIEEPSDLKGKSSVKAKSYGFSYSNGKSYNAEGFAYNNRDGHFYIATKGYSALFKLPSPLKDGMKADWVCDLPIKSKITGLDFSLDGKMLVRTYSKFYEFDKPCGKKLSEGDYGIKEKQGEAVAYYGDGFISISEGSKPDIHLVKLDDAPKTPEPKPDDKCEKLLKKLEDSQCKLK